ncbi:GNAT family N-acetyltransferase [Streptomyces sp. NPDC051976]|uniref:GNAT family N-acetyltransferase n=1 Tax=Streptomyces sp. NPDC051976 TaxID=3154947 RepID=UPI00343F7058
MTTTLRPVGPERREDDGWRARDYTVCVNGRPVGAVRLSTDRRFGPHIGRIDGLAIDEADRRRGRGTVAALAAEEVLRLWGCTRVETSVPAEAEHGLRLATTLGYVERNRNMAKELRGPRPVLPAGSVLRPLTEDEYGPWLEREREGFVVSLTDRGVPRDQAEAREAASFDEVLPQGLHTPGTGLYALTHDGAIVGNLWLRLHDPAAPSGQGWVFSVEVEAAQRGRGHGRTLMLAAETACRDAGADSLGLNVFAGNTPAVRLYEALDYRTTARHLYKTL